MGMCILVIDDDAMNLRLAAYSLNQAHYDVLLASSGAEGIEKLKENKVDLILLDIEMPVMNGMETLRIIRQDNAHVPVIFLTASGEKKDVMDALRLGAVDYVKKPFLPKDLLDRVARVFDVKS